jgi:hypothetical protein
MALRLQSHRQMRDMHVEMLRRFQQQRQLSEELNGRLAELVEVRLSIAPSLELTHLISPRKTPVCVRKTCCSSALSCDKSTMWDRQIVGFSRSLKYAFSFNVRSVDNFITTKKTKNCSRVQVHFTTTTKAGRLSKGVALHNSTLSAFKGHVPRRMGLHTSKEVLSREPTSLHFQPNMVPHSTHNQMHHIRKREDLGEPSLPWSYQLH